MATAAAVDRKQAQTADGRRLPALMVKLGVSSWTTVPNTNLEHWMDSDELPAWFRVLACIVRHSLGYQSDHCIRLEAGQQRPFKQTHICERLSMRPPHVSRAIAILESNGSIETKGQTIWFCPRPQRHLVATDGQPEPKAEEFSPFRERLRAIRAAFLRALKVAESGNFSGLEVAESGTFSGPEVADFAGLSLLPESKEKGEAESRWVGWILSVILKELQHPTNAPTHQPDSDFQELEKQLADKDRLIEELQAQLRPRAAEPAQRDDSDSRELQEIREYLRLFEKMRGKHPPEKIVRDIHARLRGVSVAHFKTLVDTRARESSFRLTSWGLFLNLADDAYQNRDLYAELDREAARHLTDAPTEPFPFHTWCETHGLQPTTPEGFFNNAAYDLYRRDPQEASAS